MSWFCTLVVVVEDAFRPLSLEMVKDRRMVWKRETGSVVSWLESVF